MRGLGTRDSKKQSCGVLDSQEPSWGGKASLWSDASGMPAPPCAARQTLYRLAWYRQARRWPGCGLVEEVGRLGEEVGMV
jgi:hypothetical protein